MTTPNENFVYEVQPDIPNLDAKTLPDVALDIWIARSQIDEINLALLQMNERLELIWERIAKNV